LLRDGLVVRGGSLSWRVLRNHWKDSQAKQRGEERDATK
jgi:hypothetical protein